MGISKNLITLEVFNITSNLDESRNKLAFISKKNGRKLSLFKSLGL